ncbi:MAG: hypothetical protein J6S06_02740 [Alphaproteobacteria bacterium]|nr:hypothetical protein [Alphaproteobacteria bacterium]
MRQLNLGFVKRVMFSVLVGLLGVVYDVDTAQARYCAGTASTITANCATYCRNHGYYTGYTNASWFVDDLNCIDGRSACLCLSTSTYDKAMSCYNSKTCASYSPIFSGGKMRFLIGAMGCSETGMCHCAPGYYGDGTNCVACTVGSYCPGGHYATNTGYKSACTVGRYASKTGLSTCTACPYGTYGSTTGLSTCTPCGYGAYNNTSGRSTACSKCAAGYYNSLNSRAYSCTACSVGYYASGTGSWACTRCPSTCGVYGTTASTGSTSVTACCLSTPVSCSDDSGEYDITGTCCAS